MHLGKTLPNGERRSWDISEEEFHELSFQFQRFSGAMLANIVNTAVILAGREGRTTIVYRDLTRVCCCGLPALCLLFVCAAHTGSYSSLSDRDGKPRWFTAIDRAWGCCAAALELTTVAVLAPTLAELAALSSGCLSLGS